MDKTEILHKITKEHTGELSWWVFETSSGYKKNVVLDPLGLAEVLAELFNKQYDRNTYRMQTGD